MSIKATRKGGSNAGDWNEHGNPASRSSAAAIQRCMDILRLALSRASTDGSLRVLAVSLLLAQKLLHQTPAAYRRPFLLLLANTVLLLTRKGSPGQQLEVGVAEEAEPFDQRLRLLAFVGCLMLLGASAQKEQSNGVDRMRAASMLLVSLRAERERFSRLLQAHLRLAVGVAPNAQSACSIGTGTQSFGTGCGAPAVSYAQSDTGAPLPNVPACSHDDIVAPMASINSAMLLLDHVERLTAITREFGFDGKGQTGGGTLPSWHAPSDIGQPANASDTPASLACALQSPNVASGMRAQARDPLYYLQGIVDALAARAGELGVHVSFALPGPLCSEQGMVCVAFPEAKDSEEVVTYGRWAMREEAIQPSRHVLLETSCILLEHYLRPGDSMCFTPHYVDSTPGSEEPSGRATSAAAVYITCRRGQGAGESAENAPVDNGSGGGSGAHATHAGVPPGRPGAGYDWQRIELDEIRGLSRFIYPDQVRFETRWIVSSAGCGPSGTSNGTKTQVRGGQNLDGSVVPVKYLAGGASGDKAGSDNWLFIRFVLPSALEPATVDPKDAGLSSVPLVEVNSRLILDAPLGFTPSLLEFRSMLHGARIILRTPPPGQRPRTDRLASTEQESRKLMNALESYLVTFASCVVDQLPLGFPIRMPATPGPAMHPVAQKPPAYVVIDDDMGALKSEFEMLRGTLTFTSSSKSQRGSPSDSRVHSQAEALAAPNIDGRGALAGMRRRGFFTATLAIVVLAPISAVAKYRDYVRVLSAMPHPLPPPVVKIVTKPLCERRLLSSLLAAWETHRVERYNAAHGTPALSPQYGLHPGAVRMGAHIFSPGVSMGGSSSAFSDTAHRLTVPNSSDLGISSDSTQDFVAKDRSATSTPHSANSEVLYQNLRMMSESPPGMSKSATFQIMTDRTLPLPQDTAAGALDDSKGTPEKGVLARSPLVNTEMFAPDDDPKSRGLDRASTSSTMAQMVAQLSSSPPPATSPTNASAIGGAVHRTQTQAGSEEGILVDLRSAGDRWQPGKNADGSDGHSGDKMAKRPPDLAIAPRTEDDAPDSPTSPLSPLIRVEPHLAATLRRATSTRTDASAGSAAGSLIADMDAASVRPNATGHRAEAAVLGSDADTSEAAGHAEQTRGETRVDGSHPLRALDTSASAPRSAAAHAEPKPLPTPSEADSTETVLRPIPTRTSVSTANSISAVPVAPTPTASTSSLALTPLPTQHPGESGLSRARSRIRDKMAAFNRAKTKARNKLLGIPDSSNSLSLAKTTSKELAGALSPMQPHQGSARTEVASDQPTARTSVEVADRRDTSPPPSGAPTVAAAVIATMATATALVSTAVAPASTPAPTPPTDSSAEKPVPAAAANDAGASSKETPPALPGSRTASVMDVSKPLPQLPAAATPPSAKNASIARALPGKPADGDAAGERKLTPAQERKAKLRARLQHASRRAAEASKAAAAESDSSSSAATGAVTDRRKPASLAQVPPAAHKAFTEPPRLKERGTRNSAGHAAKSKSGASGPAVTRQPSAFIAPPIRVLLVEDNLINRSIMERFLRHMNVSYDVASNGEEAINMWTAAAEEVRSGRDVAVPGRGPYHIVFMDIQMPIMDGITATKHIRRLERHKRIGVWVTSGSVASMAVPRTPGAGGEAAGATAAGIRLVTSPQLAGAALKGEEGMMQKNVRWTPFHARKSPAGMRNAHYLYANGLVRSVPVLPAAPPTPETVRKNRSQASLKAEQRKSGFGSGGGAIAAGGAGRAPNVPQQQAAGSVTLEVAVDNILVSPDQFDKDSVSQIAMFPDSIPKSSSSSNDRGGAVVKQDDDSPKLLELPKSDLESATVALAPSRSQDSSVSSAVIRSPVIIVALTASSLQSDRRAALAAGCNDFLTKPVSLIWLKKKIMEWGCMQALIDHDGWRKWRSAQDHVSAEL